MHCENCGKKLDCHSNVNDETLNPKEGDISICMYCGEVNQFKNGRLELIDIKNLPKDVQQEVLRIEQARQKVMS